MSLSFSVEPQVSRRHCGGWLALSPDGETLKRGTTGATEAEAVESFRQIFAAYKSDLAGADRVNVSA